MLLLRYCLCFFNSSFIFSTYNFSFLSIFFLILYKSSVALSLIIPFLSKYTSSFTLSLDRSDGLFFVKKLLSLRPFFTIFLKLSISIEVNTVLYTFFNSFKFKKYPFTINSKSFKIS